MRTYWFIGAREIHPLLFQSVVEGGYEAQLRVCFEITFSPFFQAQFQLSSNLWVEFTNNFIQLLFRIP